MNHQQLSVENCKNGLKNSHFATKTVNFSSANNKKHNKMKHFFTTKMARYVAMNLLLMLTLVGGKAYAQIQTVTIGNGTISTYMVPVNNYYRYTYCEMIFTPEEIGATGNIAAIGFQSAGSTYSKNNVKIYLRETDKTSFSSASDYVTDDFTLVYSGNLNCSSGWNTYNFSAPFVYSGQNNLMVLVVDNSNSYDGSSYYFYCTSTSDYKTLDYYSDYDAPTYTSPNLSMNTDLRTDRPNTRFVFREPCSFLDENAGTENDPYLLENETDLFCFATEVNSGTDFSSSYFLLTNDIALTNEWESIGTSSHPFQGHVNGNGHVISGLNVTSGSYQGLFGYLSGAEIMNLTVSGSVTGSNYLGGIAGYATGSTFTNCTSNVAVSGSQYVAGLVGYLLGSSTMTNCTNLNSVTGTSSYVGGAVGYASSSTLTGCINRGNLNTTSYNAGGVVGYLYNSFAIGCENYGNVTSTSTSTTAASSGYGIGGVVGCSYYTSSGTTVVLDECINHGKVTSSCYLTGVSWVKIIIMVM